MSESRANQPGDPPASTAAELQLHLSDAEREVLELYDQLEELKLEMALLQAQSEELNGESPRGASWVEGWILTGTVAIDQQVTEAEVEAAERELLDAKASYTLRKNIVESVLVADPVLKAVHAGANATPVERCVSPRPGDGVGLMSVGVEGSAAVDQGAR